MIRLKNIYLSGLAAFGLLSCSQVPTNPIDLVDPFIGTGYHGHTYPGATVPYGGVQLSPDTRRGDWDACSGYHYSDSTLMGFSHTHLSGTGCIDLGDILIRPFMEKSIPFSHENEKATPGYYTVELPQANVNVELTATPHSGIHRYNWKKGANPLLVIDLKHTLDNETFLAADLRQTAENEVCGMRCTNGWVTNQSVYFVIQFSAPIEKAEQKEELQLALSFPSVKNSPLIAKVGISVLSEENARKNLEAETGNTFDFDALAQAAYQQWEKELDCITVEGGTKDEQINFYTALYHSKVVPNIISDVNGEYRRFDDKIGKTENNHRQFSTFSTWDTFRGWHPMMTLLDTALVGEMIHSLLNIYDASGELPLWPLSSGETNTMIGYHSVSIIADAYMKGIRSFDAEKAFEAMKVSAAKNKKGATEYISEGFIPSNQKKESVSCLLEFAYDDWCIAQMAKALGKEDDYQTFIQRSQNFVNVFDGTTGFFRGKRQDGNWEAPFNPFAIGRSYTEATAWQYRFFTPHDVYGLTQLMGGKEAFIANLDSLFNTTIEMKDQLADVTGLIGQYAHGNEPSHHMAYLYSYVGQPWKTQYWTRRLIDEMYQPTPEGIIGNEDCGQMSAWLICSSLGFYSVCPGSNQFVLTTPVFNKASIKLANGKTLTIVANQPEKNRYIASVRLNGKELDACYVTYEQLMEGGTLEYILTNKENNGWGTTANSAPYSYTTQPTVSIPSIAEDLSLFDHNVTATLQCTTQDAVIHYTLDGSEPTKDSPRYTAPITVSKTTWIKAKGFKEGFMPSRTFAIKATQTKLRPAKQVNVSKNGVSYIYVEGTFSLVADMKQAKIVEKGYMPEPSIEKARQPDHFGYIFSGYIDVPTDGVYEFYTRSDDGSVLFIDDEEVANNDMSHSAISASGRIPLAKGLHSFRLEYFEDYEGEHLSWGWKKPGDSEFSPIPQHCLKIK